VCVYARARVQTRGSMCVIALTFHCHELVLIVTIANCTGVLICKKKGI